MKARYFGLAIGALLLTSGVAWAGHEAYRLMMSKDNELCESVLALFNADMKKYYGVRYQDHEMFIRIGWQPVKLEWEKNLAPSCSVLQRAIFDVNNDGQDDLVIKWSACLRGNPIDSLYVFPKDSDAVTKLKAGPEGWGVLFDAENKFDGEQGYALDELPLEQTDGIRQGIAVAFIHPFIFRETTYVSIEDLIPDWVAINQYLGKEHFSDVCYFRYQPTAADTQDK